MKTMAISEFKAHSLQVLGRVARTKETVVVTKRGKPLVEVIPFRHGDESPAPGKIVGNAGVRERHRLAVGRIDLERLQVKYLLDTHVWVWWNMRPENLSRKVKGLIAASQKVRRDSLVGDLRVGILQAPGKGASWNLLRSAGLAGDRLGHAQASTGVAEPGDRLPLHACCRNLTSADPADQIIVATAQEENATLLTKDKLIHQSACVHTIW